MAVLVEDGRSAVWWQLRAHGDVDDWLMHPGRLVVLETREREPGDALEVLSVPREQDCAPEETDPCDEIVRHPDALAVGLQVEPDLRSECGLLGAEW